MTDTSDVWTVGRMPNCIDIRVANLKAKGRAAFIAYLLALAAASLLCACTTGYDLRPVPATPGNLALAVRDKDVDRLHPGKIIVCLRTPYRIGAYTAETVHGDGNRSTEVVDRKWSTMIADPKLVDSKLCGVEELRTNGLGDTASPRCLAASELSAVMLPTEHRTIDGSVLETWVGSCPGSPAA